MKHRKIKRPVVVALTLLVVVIFCNSQNGKKELLNHGNIAVPHERRIVWNTESQFYESMVALWSKKSVQYGPKKGKVDNPRILLAQLHSKTNVKEINQVIMGMEPWGVSGSSWALNKLGDYDFTATVLTSILWQFGDKPELLYKETVN